MRLLLDTHVLLALVECRSGSLSAGIERLLQDRENEHYFSAASLWEIAIKWRLGKLKLRPSLSTLPELVRALGIQIVAVTEHHAVAVVKPEPVTGDPFDRMLLAQCQIENLQLVTVDRALLNHRLALKI